jgi:hypothetical protein
MRWKMVLMNGFPIYKVSKCKLSFKWVSVVVNGFQEVWVPPDDDGTFLIHKKHQVYKVYVKCTRKLLFVSLFLVVKKDICKRINDY